MNRPRLAMLILCLLAIAVAGCDRTEAPSETVGSMEAVVSFDGGVVRIETETDTFVVNVEVAETDEQRRAGLMRRPSLAADSGMIFIFQSEQSPDDVFWMFNTLVPLSIAFIDADGTIGSIRDMEPCPSQDPQYCPYYEARVSFQSALEVNRGYFAERGITVGDRVVLERN